MDWLTFSESRLLLYVGVFFGVLVTLEGLKQVFAPAESGNRARSRRLRRLKPGASADEALMLLRTQRSRWQRIPLIGQFPQMMRQAGIDLGPITIFAGIGLIMIAAFLPASWFLGPAPAFVAAVALGVLVPFAALQRLAMMRIDKLVSQLPDALDLMARGLRVGHPLNVTITSVAKDMPQPIANEFAHVADQIAYGDDLPEAIGDLAKRIDQEDFQFLSAAVVIQHGSGGNLVRVFSTLSSVIRDRAALRRKVVAISSEGRLSALILSLLPVLIFGITTFSSPTYYGQVSDDPLFLPISATVVALVIANFLVLRRLVNFKV